MKFSFDKQNFIIENTSGTLTSLQKKITKGIMETKVSFQRN